MLDAPGYNSNWVPDKTGTQIEFEDNTNDNAIRQNNKAQ